MTRKIIQLVPTYDEDEYLVMYALCDDGTVWWTAPTPKSEEKAEANVVWYMVSVALPQDLPKDR